MSYCGCEYDYTRSVSEDRAKEYFRDNFKGNNYAHLKLISECEFNFCVDHYSVQQFAGLSNLCAYNNGRYLSLVFNPGLNGETWFYYENLDV